jgi:hypothetical protein
MANSIATLAVVRCLIESVDRVLRMVRLSYVNPVEGHPLLEMGRARPVRRLRRLRAAAEWSRPNLPRMYQITPLVTECGGIGCH